MSYVWTELKDLIEMEHSFYKIQYCEQNKINKDFDDLLLRITFTNTYSSKILFSCNTCDPNLKKQYVENSKHHYLRKAKCPVTLIFGKLPQDFNVDADFACIEITNTRETDIERKAYFVIPLELIFNGINLSTSNLAVSPYIKDIGQGYYGRVQIKSDLDKECSAYYFYINGKRVDFSETCSGCENELERSVGNCSPMNCEHRYRCGYKSKHMITMEMFYGFLPKTHYRKPKELMRYTPFKSYDFTDVLLSKKEIEAEKKIRDNRKFVAARKRMAADFICKPQCALCPECTRGFSAVNGICYGPISQDTLELMANTTHRVPDWAILSYIMNKHASFPIEEIRKYLTDKKYPAYFLRQLRSSGIALNPSIDGIPIMIDTTTDKQIWFFIVNKTYSSFTAYETPDYITFKRNANLFDTSRTFIKSVAGPKVKFISPSINRNNMAIIPYEVVMLENGEEKKYIFDDIDIYNLTKYISENKQGTVVEENKTKDAVAIVTDSYSVGLDSISCNDKIQDIFISKLVGRGNIRIVVPFEFMTKNNIYAKHYDVENITAQEVTKDLEILKRVQVYKDPALMVFLYNLFSSTSDEITAYGAPIPDTSPILARFDAGRIGNSYIARSLLAPNSSDFLTTHNICNGEYNYISAKSAKQMLATNSHRHMIRVSPTIEHGIDRQQIKVYFAYVDAKIKENIDIPKKKRKIPLTLEEFLNSSEASKTWTSEP